MSAAQNNHQPVYSQHCHTAPTKDVNFTISTDDDLQQGINDIRAFNAGGAVFDAEFDGKTVNFHVSVDGVNFYILAGSTLSPTSGPVALSLPAALFNFPFFKFGTTTAMSSNGVIKLSLKSNV